MLECSGSRCFISTNINVRGGGSSKRAPLPAEDMGAVKQLPLTETEACHRLH